MFGGSYIWLRIVIDRPSLCVSAFVLFHRSRRRSPAGWRVRLQLHLIGFGPRIIGTDPGRSANIRSDDPAILMQHCRLRLPSGLLSDFSLQLCVCPPSCACRPVITHTQIRHTFGQHERAPLYDFGSQARRRRSGYLRACDSHDRRQGGDRQPGIFSIKLALRLAELRLLSAKLSNRCRTRTIHLVEGCGGGRRDRALPVAYEQPRGRPCEALVNLRSRQGLSPIANCGDSQ